MFRFTAVLLMSSLLLLPSGTFGGSKRPIKNVAVAAEKSTMKPPFRSQHKAQNQQVEGINNRGFTYLPSTGSSYKAIFESHSWDSASKKCRELRNGSHLIAITSEVENREVKTFIARELSRNLGNTACIGVGHNWGFAFWTSGQQLIKNDCSSPYVWKLSNDKLLAFDFTKWRKGEPFCGNAGEMCVLLPVYNDFLWDDHYCSNTICPLCEYTPDEFDPIYVNL